MHGLLVAFETRLLTELVTIGSPIILSARQVHCMSLDVICVHLTMYSCPTLEHQALVEATIRAIPNVICTRTFATYSYPTAAGASGLPSKRLGVGITKVLAPRL